MFHVNSGVTASLNRLTIADGYALSGGGIYNNHGTLTVTNSAAGDHCQVAADNCQRIGHALLAPDIRC